MYIRMNGNNCKNLTNYRLFTSTKGAKKDKSSGRKQTYPQEIYHMVKRHAWILEAMASTTNYCIYYYNLLTITNIFI